jgi:hypothetical protein
MDSNLVGGFVMAGIGMLIGLIGSLLYCFFGIGCKSTIVPDGEIQEGRETEARKAVDSEGNPTVQGEVEGEVEA